MLRYYANGRIRWKNAMRCNTRTNWEFYVVTAGRCGPVFRDGEKPQLRERTLWIFAPECCHAWADDGHRTYHRLSFHFGSVPYPLDELVRSRGGWFAKPVTDAQIARIERVAADLEPHFCKPTQVSPLHFQRGLTELALLALEGETFADAPTALTDLAHFKVERALSWYSEHLARHPSVKEVAEAIHVSPSHLRRLFRSVRGGSPKSLFQSVRLEKASELMARTTLALDDIARATGYANASHLCRDYKSAHHFTPTTWRRRLIDRFTSPLPAGVVPVREYSARVLERTMRA
jgi:AraC family transcriptional regulator